MMRSFFAWAESGEACTRLRRASHMAVFETMMKSKELYFYLKRKWFDL